MDTKNDLVSTRHKSFRTPLLCISAFVVMYYGLGALVEPARVLAPLSRTTKGTVKDAYTSLTISDTIVLTGQEAAYVTDNNGEFYATDLIYGTPVTFEASEHKSIRIEYGGEQELSITLMPTVAKGVVVASDIGKPIEGASVVLNGVRAVTDAKGTFRFDAPPEKGTLVVMAPGYAKEQVPFERQSDFLIKLASFAVKGLYVSFNSAGWPERREHLVDLADSTEVNALVIDTKGDYGSLNYRAAVPLAKEAGATSAIVDDMPALVARLKKKGIYLVARVVTFKDQVLPKLRPDLAVKKKNGALFVDDEGLTWLDPFRKEVWDYNLSIAEELARMGFDEIQFDYVRFPSDGKLSDNLYSKENNEGNRRAAIKGFLQEANRRLKPLGVFISADTFGWTMVRDDDLGIGQKIEDIAGQLDYLCPMVYPSTWGMGSIGVSDPVGQPYDIVLKSLQRGQERLKAIPTVKMRPWLQDFNDYGASKRVYGEKDLKAQMKAGQDAGGSGWMLWNPGSIYTESALARGN